MPRVSIRPYDRVRAASLFAAALVLMSISALRLDSGLRVALCPRHGTGTVSMSAWIGAGSADEATERAGLAHLAEHMLFKGTANRGVGDIAAELESAGGDINAWTTFDNIVVQLRVPTRAARLGLNVIADMLSAPSFDPNELELERGVVLDELEQAIADPHRALGRALFQAVFRRHPYRRAILGTHRSVGKIERADLVRFSRWINATNVVVSVAGDFDRHELTELARTELSRMEPGPLPPRRTPMTSQRRCRERVATAPVGEAQIIIAFPTPPVHSRAHLLLDMVSVALGQGASSILAADLEGEGGIATSTGAYVHGFRDASVFIATASSDIEDTSECAQELAERVFRMTSHALDDHALGTVKNAIVSDAVYGRETVSGLAAAMGAAWSVGSSPDDTSTRLAWAREATADDIANAAREYLRPQRATIAALVPDHSASGGRLARLVERASKAVLGSPSSPSSASVRPTPKKPITTKPTSRSSARSANTRRLVLKNGTVIVVHPDNTVPLVAAQATWPGGLRVETKTNAGIGALLAATVTRGCADTRDEQLARVLDRKAATLSGFSGRNSFGLRAEWIADGDHAVLSHMLDCISAPRFEAAIVEGERRRLEEEAEARTQSPAHLAHRMFVETIYGEHPYALDALGAAPALKALAGSPSRDVRAHYRRHYPASAMTIAIVGDVDPDAIIARLTDGLGNIKPTAKSPKTAASIAQTKTPTKAQAAQTERQRFAYLDRPRAHLVVGFPGVTLADPDRHALTVLAAVLGGQGGRLFASMRERQGLVYRVAAHSLDGVDPGTFAVVTSCNPKNTDKVLAIIRAELDKLRSTTVSAAELRRAKTFLEGATNHSLERRGTLAAALAYAEAHGLGYKSVFRSNSELAKITAADLRRVAERIINWNLAATSTVLPPTVSPAVDKRARGVRRKLPAAAARKRSRP